MCGCTHLLKTFGHKNTVKKKEEEKKKVESEKRKDEAFIFVRYFQPPISPLFFIFYPLPQFLYTQYHPLFLLFVLFFPLKTKLQANLPIIQSAAPLSHSFSLYFTPPRRRQWEGPELGTPRVPHQRHTEIKTKKKNTEQCNVMGEAVGEIEEVKKKKKKKEVMGGEKKKKRGAIVYTQVSPLAFSLYVASSSSC